jgi:hypothetical protein
MRDELLNVSVTIGLERRLGYIYPNTPLLRMAVV